LSSELDQIAAALAPAPALPPPVLVTLMSVAGSAYRGPGARMVVRGDDTTVGAISGGCLERDVVEHARRVRGGEAEVVKYDLTRDDDAPWGLNMGCNAKLDVLLEPCPAGEPEYLRSAREHLARRTAVVVATCFQTDKASPGVGRQASGVKIGDRAIMAGNDAPVTGVLAEGPLGGKVRGDANRVMDEERSDVVTYATDAGAVHVLHEYLARPLRLVICGEGADVAPLERLGRELGWQVVTVGKDAALPDLDDRSAAVVMTHNYARDAALLAQLLPSRARYVGLLGPKQRTARLLAGLEQSGNAPNPGQLMRLHAPVGLDIGAETPEEVALAIAAEVRAQMAGRSGGKLKVRQGPIHERR
jgi:xanthine dehydrogenase accessory factor